MRRKREKGYWVKKKESYKTGDEAKSRAGNLRIQENIEHVTVNKECEIYLVEYSIAKWYLEECEKAGIKI